MSLRASQVRITAHAATSRPRWHALAHRLLSLDKAEADRALEVVPVVLTVGPASDIDRQRLDEGLKALSISAQIDPSGAERAACVRHKRLLESDVCPRCGERACGACVRLARQALCPRCAKTRGRWAAFRRFRIAALLLTLAVVGGATYFDKARFSSWKKPVHVVVHPIIVEDTLEVGRYVHALDSERFVPVARFIDAQARLYGRAVEPAAVSIELGPEVHQRPPAVPVEPNIWTAIRWSLAFRWWVFKTVRSEDLPPADVRMFVQYHVATAGRSLAHSTGIEQARAGAVNLFAATTAEGQNSVVLAHEILHTLGATDQYGPDGLPIALGDPAQRPLYPQTRADVMAGQIALSATEAKMPDTLELCVVGAATAQEIGWKAGP